MMEPTSGLPWALGALSFSNGAAAVSSLEGSSDDYSHLLIIFLLDFRINGLNGEIGCGFEVS